MTTPSRRSIAETFTELRKQQQIALMPFIPAGYPDLETTAALLPALEAGGANLIEIGIPFSDPIADGPIIQAAFTEALSKGLRLEDIFKTIERCDRRCRFRSWRWCHSASFSVSGRDRFAMF